MEICGSLFVGQVGKACFNLFAVFLVEKCEERLKSSARSKIEGKKRTKVVFLHNVALSDAKKSRKYHSFSPQKLPKHCYLQGFVHVTILDFLKNVYIYIYSMLIILYINKYQRFCGVHHPPKKKRNGSKIAIL